MNPEVQLLVYIWDAVKNYIPKKDRLEAAEHLVRVFDEESDLSGIEDEISTLDVALRTAVKTHYSDHDDYDDEEDWD